MANINNNEFKTVIKELEKAMGLEVDSAYYYHNRIYYLFVPPDGERESICFSIGKDKDFRPELFNEVFNSKIMKNTLIYSKGR